MEDLLEKEKASIKFDDIFPNISVHKEIFFETFKDDIPNISVIRKYSLKYLYMG